MRDLFVTIYIARKEDAYRVGLTHNPNIEAEIFQKSDIKSMFILTPFLPLGLADYLIKNYFKEQEIVGQNTRSISLIGSRLAKEEAFQRYLERMTAKFRSIVFSNDVLVKELKDFWGRGDYPRQVSLRSMSMPYDGFADDEDYLYRCLEGRMLYLEELEKALRENKLQVVEDLQDVLHRMALKGVVQVTPAVEVDQFDNAYCRRCGNTTTVISKCSSCGLQSMICDHCSPFGEARSCRALYSIKKSYDHGSRSPKTCSIRIPEKPSHTTFLQRERLPNLTVSQVNASMRLKKFVSDHKNRECLLWAVTGAGKTEIVLAAIDHILGQGGKVLYAAPRRDVVAEISPRLQNYFPKIQVLTSYGGSTNKYSISSLVAATTHQVMRYYNQFDLAIIDEVDAFPYQGDALLSRGVQRSLKPEGKIVYLTATPNREMIAKAQQGQMALITIPARYHGHQLPVPNMVQEMSFLIDRETNQLILNPIITEKLKRWGGQEGKQVFLFLPTVQKVETYFPAIKEALATTQGLSFQTLNVDYCHARDRDREMKRERFKRGEIDVFVTTSIMERGITVKNANVMILEADFSTIFDEGTLIQMAGRSGRSSEFPDGEVVFVGKTITESMQEACNIIRFLNRYASGEASEEVDDESIKYCD